MSDQRLNFGGIFAAALAAVFLAVEQLPGVAEHDLEASGGARVFGRREPYAVAERRQKLGLEAVVEPHVPSAAAVHDLARSLFVMVKVKVVVQR